MKINIVSDLLTALKMQAGNWRLQVSDNELCWCRFADWTVNPKCQNQPNCEIARDTIAKAASEESE